MRKELVRQDEVWRGMGGGAVRVYAVGGLVAVALTCLAPVLRAQNPLDQPTPAGTYSQSGSSSQPASSAPGVNLAPVPMQTENGTRSLGQGDLSTQPYGSRELQDAANQTERNGRMTGTNPLEPVPLTPFQRLVAASTGKILPIFGASLFTNVPSTFAPVDRIPVTPEYVMGPGDELLIRIWGQVTLDGHFTVDRSGDVYIPHVGAVRVAGVPFAKLTDYLRAQIGHTFRNFDINVNVGQLRSIQIFVVGEARRPGSYTISSLSTLVNALFATGGPSPMGSLRKIQVKRGGETVTTFDMYDLLLKGDKSKDVQLLSGDVVYIPPAGAMAAVAGSVQVPAVYELGTVSTVKEMLALAGGLSTLAQDKRLRIERIVEHEARSVADVTLDAAGLATPLKDGDLLEVSPIVDRFKDAVTLRGSVAEPRRFAWFAGMRVRDLIPDKEALLTRDYWRQRNELGLPVLDSTPDVRRYAPDAPVAQINGVGVGPVKSTAMMNAARAAEDGDTNVYGTQRPFTSTNAVSGGGSENSNNNTTASTRDVITPDTTRVARSGNISTQDFAPDVAENASGTSVSAAVTGVAQRFPVKNTVVLSAPDVDWAYAVVQRMDVNDLTSRLIPFNLGRVVIGGDDTQNLLLQPGDVVTIFSKADIRVPQSQQTKYVRLDGEFAAAGTYSVDPGETLRHLVGRAGGLTAGAYLYGSQFTRESTRVLQQQRLNEYAADLDRRIKLAEANSTNNALNPQDEVANIAGLQSARTVAMRLRQLRASGRIVLNVRPQTRTIDELPDLPLEDGDTFVVPQVPSTVDVFGSVYTQNSFLYDPRKHAGDYLRQAGGATRTADNRRSYIVRADGSIISRQFSSALFFGNFDATHLYPGDAVIVPEAVDRRPLLRNLVDLATITGQFGLGIAAINLLK